MGFCATTILTEDSRFYSLTANDIDTMNTVEMGDYRGKVLLIVNVASECGYTENHYRELVDLQRSYPKTDFQVLAFPCNQFGKQEPKNNKYVSKFAKDNYNVNFQLFGKIKTIGQYSHPIFKWIKKETDVEPNWNFNKFLVDKTGKIQRYAASQVSPLQMSADIQNLIANRPLQGGLHSYATHSRDEL